MEIDKTLLERVFPPEEYKIELENSNNEYTIKTHDEQQCLTLTFFTDHIYIDSLYKCGKSGTDSLGKVYKLAQMIPNVKYIELEDDSGFDKCDYYINLAIIKILTKGESWYNSLGYVSDNYETEKTKNKEILEMKYEDFVDFVDKVYEFDLEKIKKENTRERYRVKIANLNNLNEINKNEIKVTNKEEKHYKDLELWISKRQETIDEYTQFLENYEEHIKEIIAKFILERETHKRRGFELFPYTRDETVKAVFTRILKYIQSQECDRDKLDWLHSFLKTIHNMGILQYDRILKKTVRKGSTGCTGCTAFGGSKGSTGSKGSKKKTKKAKKSRRKNKAATP